MLLKNLKQYYVNCCMALADAAKNKEGRLFHDAYSYTESLTVGHQNQLRVQSTWILKKLPDCRSDTLQKLHNLSHEELTGKEASMRKTERMTLKQQEGSMITYATCKYTK